MDREELPRTNEELRQRFARDTVYKNASVLAIYWEEADHKGFEREAKEVQELFQNDFHFEALTFPIPSTRSTTALTSRISKLLEDNDAEDTLLIIHYGGHGDDDQKNQSESVWLPTAAGDKSRVRWSIIQECLKDHPSTVLLLLDCCFASQAARHSNSSLPPNMELWAACGAKDKTVLPGPNSFTSIMVNEIKELLKSHGRVTLADVHRNMANRYSKFKQSAVYFPLSDEKGNIVLSPLRQSQDMRPFLRPEQGSMLVRISIARLDKDALRAIIQWFMKNPPQEISNLTILDPDKVAALEKYIRGDGEQTGSVAKFNDLPDEAQQDISSVWNRLITSISRVFTSSKALSSNHLSHDTSQNQDNITAGARELSTEYESVKDTIERRVMSSTDIKEQDKLRKAIDNGKVEELGFQDTLKLRLALQSPLTAVDDKLDLSGALESEQYDLAGPVVTQQTRSSLFPQRIATYQKRLGVVLIETRAYTERINFAMISRSRPRVQRLAQLLSHCEPGEFRTLKCCGYCFEPHRGGYRLVFSIPEGSRQKIISLQELVLGENPNLRKPTLGERYNIALAIEKAIRKWHLVNWIHQGVASYNIIFFHDDNEVDYANPYLCGFDYARDSSYLTEGNCVTDFEFNVYRHPDRQGTPTYTHQKKHDLYAYGILLLELGMWKLVGDIFKNPESRNISPQRMGEVIRDEANKNLSHLAGRKYQEATRICLEDDFGVILDDKLQSHLAKAFEVKVLKQIDKGIDLG